MTFERDSAVPDDPSVQPASHFLEISTLVYLVLPYFLFAFGWLWIYYAFPFATVVAFGAFHSIRRWFPVLSRTESQLDLAPNGRTLAIVLIAVFWSALSGAGGVGLQNHDYLKHNAVLKDLIDFEWPVYYGRMSTSGPPSYLVYCVAYYLPAAGVGKLFGWNAANHFMFLWTVLGVTLSLCWFIRLVGRKSLLAGIGFVFAGGMDAVGYFPIAGKAFPFPEHMEWWASDGSLPDHLSSVAQYSGNTALLYWVPQHCLPGWLLTGLIVSESTCRRGDGTPILLTSLAALWSPFVFVGLLPIGAVACLRSGSKPFSIARDVFVGGLIVAVTALFYKARTGRLFNGWIWDLYDFTFIVPRVSLFFLIEVGIYFALAFAIVRSVPPSLKYFVLASFFVLLLLPLYRMGYNNDLAMRASIPALFILWAFVFRALTAPRRECSRVVKPVLICALLIGSLSSLSESARSIRDYSARPPSYSDTKGMGSLGAERASNYIGTRYSIFFWRLAKTPRQVDHVPD